MSVRTCRYCPSIRKHPRTGICGDCARKIRECGGKVIDPARVRGRWRDSPKLSESQRDLLKRQLILKTPEV